MARPFSVATSKMHRQAQANADHFNHPYVCFFDISGQYRCERYNEDLYVHNGPNATMFWPKKKREKG